MAFGVFQDFYTTTWLTKYSASAISCIGGMQYFLELAGAPIAGKLFDAGYFRISVISGSLLSSARFVFSRHKRYQINICYSIFMLSLVKQNQYYQVFLTQSLGMGIGLSLLYLPTMTVISRHMLKHRALAMVYSNFDCDLYLCLKCIIPVAGYRCCKRSIGWHYVFQCVIIGPDF